LATAGLSDDPVAIGAVSVPMRSIPSVPPKLGVVITDGDTGPLVVRVFPGTGAEQAGLKAQDVITHVDGNEVKDREALTSLIQKLRIGDSVQLKVLRGDEELELSAKLIKIQNDATRQRDRMNASNVGVSRRRHDFPAVLQHDTVLKPVDCGGPVVDLSGRVVGVNIARGGRTETYCMPSDVLLARMYDLMSGRLAPERKVEPKTESQTEPDDAEKQKAKPEAKPETQPEKQPPPSPDNEPESEGDPDANQQNRPEPEGDPEAKPQENDEQKPQNERQPPSENQTPPEKQPPEKQPQPAPQAAPNQADGGEDTPDSQPNSDDRQPHEEKPSDDGADRGKEPQSSDSPTPQNGDTDPQPDSQPEPAE
jgi:hypothetical protein